MTDVRKWMSSFGKNSSSSSSSSAGDTGVLPSLHSSPRVSADQREERSNTSGASFEEGKNEGKANPAEGKTDDDDDADKGSVVEAASIDQNALSDAISSDVSPTLPSREVDGISEEVRAGSEEGTLDLKQRSGDEEGEDEKRTIQGLETPKAPPMFLRKSVYLQGEEDPLATNVRKVHFLLVRAHSMQIGLKSTNPA